MVKKRKHSVKRVFGRAAGFALTAVLIYSCANIGRPDGGSYDLLPPRFIKSTPEQGAVNNTQTKIVLEFDEIIKLEKANEKVIISPPQVQMPEIKTNGRKITIPLVDSLKANTTYTIDFSDAIVDNNEGNPLGNFAFTFSTGEAIDSMEVSGCLLDASNLEPIKGMLVGLHTNLEDSAFNKLPFERVSQTDSRGHFTIRGIAPGTYRIYGLQDAGQNFFFDQKSEMIAFNDSLVIPRFEERMRRDTVWKDTLTVDTIIQRMYTHYLPDNLVLRAFKEKLLTQYMAKNERVAPHKFTLYFAAQADTLPTVKGINFDSDSAFIIERSLKRDTIGYWIKDSLIYNMDTLSVSVNYLFTDTTGLLVPRTDTLYLAKRKVNAKATKEKERKKKKGEEEEPEPTKFLTVKVNAPSTMDIYKNVSFLFEEPIAWIDSAGILLEEKVDTIWKPIPHSLEQDSINIRLYELKAMWDPGKEYNLTVDSTTFHGLYGLHSNKINQKFKTRPLEEYSELFLSIKGAAPQAVAELLDAQDKVIRSVPVVDGQADFYYLNPGKYYIRMFNDWNGNGIWDTGLYEEKRQPEELYYYPGAIELKALWGVNQDWNLNTVPLDRQKPQELKKQKPDEAKKTTQDREKERQRQRQKGH